MHKYMYIKIIINFKRTTHFCQFICGLFFVDLSITWHVFEPVTSLGLHQPIKFRDNCFRNAHVTLTNHNQDNVGINKKLLHG